MSVTEEELPTIKADSIPDFAPIGPDSSTASSLLQKVRANRGKGRVSGGDEESRSRAPREKVTGKGKTNHEKRANKVANMVTGAGMGVSVVALFFPHTHIETDPETGRRTKVPDDVYMRDAKCFSEGSDLVGEQWAKWADENEKVARAIDRMSAGGAGAMAILSLGAIIVPILANHSVIPQMVAQGFTPKAIEAMIEKLKAQEEE